MRHQEQTNYFIYTNFLFFNLCYNINAKYKIDFKIHYLDTAKKEWQMRKDTKNFIKSTTPQNYLILLPK
jgi:hypothetical protein